MKLAIIGHDLKFINDAIKRFEAREDIEIKIDLWEGHTIHQVTKSIEIVNWADVLFCEWGLGNVVWYQEHKKEHQVLIVRMHRFEMNTPFPEKFDFTKIDKVIAISSYIFEEFHRVAKIPRDKMVVIPNGVDVERFHLPKEYDANFRIGLLGYVPKLKRLDRALAIFEKLCEKDSRYSLSIKGKHPKEFSWVWNNQQEHDYYTNVFRKIDKSPYSNQIQFEEWGDSAEWLQSIGYVLSVSDYESFHLAPMEGMASRAVPIVLNREGARTIFPDEYIFETIDQAAEFIANSKKESGKKLVEFVKKHYCMDKMCSEILSLIDELQSKLVH
ncbi:glycosyltransferase [Bacillus sp. AFS017336]|uniref:glycosyltransferase n=1 Tax=Bacillus sp. AFS017336 TaxID=2033489 RepID=UPI000BF13EC0|nr:glycosyltransferase [Bacillus sp. AFS017336]PEL13540.1 glycosyl transferase family 1 [Bacillus sp. AFS017336]